MRILQLAAWVAALYLLLAVQSALGERAFQPECEVVVKFSSPIICPPDDSDWAGKEVICDRNDPAGALLSESDLTGIRYTFPSHLRRDSTVVNRFGRKVKRPNLDGVYTIRFESEMSRNSALQQLVNLPGVEWANPHYAEKQCRLEPNDHYYQDGSQNNLHDPYGDHDIDCLEAWNIETGEASTKK